MTAPRIEVSAAVLGEQNVRHDQAVESAQRVRLSVTHIETDSLPSRQDSVEDRAAGTATNYGTVRIGNSGERTGTWSDKREVCEHGLRVRLRSEVRATRLGRLAA